MSAFKQTFNRLSGFYKDGTAQYFKYISYFVGAYCIYDITSISRQMAARANPSIVTLNQNSTGPLDSKSIELPADFAEIFNKIQEMPDSTH